MAINVLILFGWIRPLNPQYRYISGSGPIWTGSETLAEDQASVLMCSFHHVILPLDFLSPIFQFLKNTVDVSPLQFVELLASIGFIPGNIRYRTVPYRTVPLIPEYLHFLLPYHGSTGIKMYLLYPQVVINSVSYEHKHKVQ